VIGYTEGNVTGELVQDYWQITKESKKIKSEFVLASRVHELERQQADGIIGLAAIETDGCQLFMDEMINQGIIKESMFTIFVGKLNEDDSWIEFGKHTDDFDSITWHETREEFPLWDLKIMNISYGEKRNVTLGPDTIRINSNIPAFAVPERDIISFIKQVAGNSQIYEVSHSPFFAVKWEGRHIFEDLVFHLDGFNSTISRYEYLIYDRPFWVFKIIAQRRNIVRRNRLPHYPQITLDSITLASLYLSKLRYLKRKNEILNQSNNEATNHVVETKDDGYFNQLVSDLSEKELKPENVTVKGSGDNGTDIGIFSSYETFENELGDWKEPLKDYLSTNHLKTIYHYLKFEYQNSVWYPPQNLIFNAFKKTPFEKTKVVIVGQDPYVNEGEAMGLWFSVPKSVKCPPSLINIYKALSVDSDVNFTLPNPVHGDLQSWTEQGVLLLNTVLTVKAGKSFSHYKAGWK
jgi:hypothetical protein